jgi:hypothetical protein
MSSRRPSVARIRSALGAALERGRRAGRQVLGLQSGRGFYDDSPSASTVALLVRLRARNLASRAPVTGAAPVTVVMTTTAARIASVWAAIESIGAGTERPARLILWLDDPALAELPTSLRRLERRGLEVRRVDPGLRVHTKWWPYVQGIEAHRVPMVTSDDDQLYPPHWLTRLHEVAQAHPAAVVAHRAHRVALGAEGLAPYTSWEPVRSTSPGFGNFGTSVSGQLFPAALLDRLREAGMRFLQATPNADDVWLYAQGVKAGFPTVQTGIAPANYPFVPGSQTGGLYLENVLQEGNDRQLAAVLDETDLERIAHDVRR